MPNSTSRVSGGGFAFRKDLLTASETVRAVDTASSREIFAVARRRPEAETLSGPVSDKSDAFTKISLPLEVKRIS
jgi:hypothetical protein